MLNIMTMKVPIVNSFGLKLLLFFILRLNHIQMYTINPSPKAFL